jgi:hypothetical protein
MIKLDNVILGMHDDGKGGKTEATVDTYIEPLIEELAIKHPEWKFEHHYARRNLVSASGGVTWVYERMKVMDKYEEIGQIGIDYTRAGKRFWINNHRVEGMRERGSGVKTTDIKKAIRHVDKFFGRKNLNEKLAEARDKAKSVIDGIARDKYFKHQNVWGAIQDDARQYIAENIQAFMAATNNPKKAELFPEAVQELEHANNVRNMTNSHKSHLVFIEGMNYSVSLGQSLPQIMTSEELPAFIRMGVGMLKLVEDGVLITNIGFRVDESTFVVLPQSEENHEQ